MKKTIIAFIFAALLLVSSASAVVIRNVTAELKEQQEMYDKYRLDYIRANDLEGYERYIYEPNLINNFGFYSPSRYIIPADVYQAAFNPPLQGDLFKTDNRPYGNSLNQPSAVKYYAENTKGRLSGHILPDKNGVYFDHPYATANVGYLGAGNNYYAGYNYGYGYQRNYGNYYGSPYGNNLADDIENARYYARVAQPLSDNYYVVSFR